MHSVRKVCGSMSSKSNILVLSILLVLGGLQAQSLIWSDFSVTREKDLNKKDNFVYKHDLNFEKNLNKQLSLTISNTFYATENLLYNYNEKGTNDLNTSLFFKNDQLSSYVGYRLKNYRKSTDIFIYIDPNSMRRDNLHDFYFQGDISLDKLRVSGGVLNRQLNYQSLPIDSTWGYDPDQAISEKDKDFLWNSRLDYQLFDDLTLFAETDVKDSKSQEDHYDNNYYNMGINFSHQFDYFKWIEISESWVWDTSDRIKNDNQLLSQIRYKQRIGTNLNGYISYINRLSYLDKEFLLLSNYLRMDVKYSFNTDIHGESYAQAGFKVSPQNKAGAIFVKSDYNVWNNIYLGYDYDNTQIIHGIIQGDNPFVIQGVIHSNTFHAKWCFYKCNLYTEYNITKISQTDEKTSSLTVGMVLAY